SQKKVKNSFGQAEVRYKVSTKVIMFGVEFEAEFTLTDRSKMRNPILLGRKILIGRFIVDVQEVNLSKKSLK
ncbi:RimK/LysX family protein, partial [Aquiflexum sp.]|uniref:putative ATP-dependent zinc protease n=1 Tax=Aquiflexum sp. TaxID=1872584 RepID=UPI0035943C84